MKQFDIPTFYRSPIIGKIKSLRKAEDPRKKDFTPTTLDFGPIRVSLARHFGFCYGVENAIEIAYKTINSHPDRNIFMLSQMIHNPTVNEDLQQQGLRFIQDTHGNQLCSWDEVHSDDIVIIPAFGTTLEIQQLLEDKGIETEAYNTTCPFVEKVWKMADKLGSSNHTILIHGKHSHEETRATFSHSQAASPSLVIRDIQEARLLAEMMLGKRPWDAFEETFQGKYSAGFDPERDLDKVGVINQTTMLASETHAIAEFFKSVMIEKFGEENIKSHFADTRDTLCYATNDNQQATAALLELPADVAIVVGGYNSSNTSHISDLCAERFPTFFINGPDEIHGKSSVHHFNYGKQERIHSAEFLPDRDPIHVVLTSGASCPDAVVETVLRKLLSFYEGARAPEEVLESLGQ